jgi:hypothetical protein
MTEVSAAPEGAPPAAMADAPSEGVAVVIAEPSIADPSPPAQQSAPVALQRRT